jgi:hypothetical protein
MSLGHYRAVLRIQAHQEYLENIKKLLEGCDENALQTAFTAQRLEEISWARCTSSEIRALKLVQKYAHALVNRLL